MKKISRCLSLLSTLSALTLVHPKKGWTPLALWLPKLLAGTCSPFLGIAGGLAGLLGLAAKDWKGAATGLLGAALAARHVARVTAPHDGFRNAFGPDWEASLPSGLPVCARRYTLLPPCPRRVPWQRDVIFGTHRETGEPLLCDLWQPPDDVPPTGLGIIYLHGSGWHYLDKDAGTRPFFRRLAEQGHLIMDVAYTLAPKADMRAMLADVKRAIAWLKTEGSEHAVNPERIVLMGGSAGAHLALLAAYAPEHGELKPADVEMDTGVRAVVSYYGPCDLLAQHRRIEEHMGDLGLARCREFLGRLGALAPDDAGKTLALTDLVANALGASPEEAPALYRLFSPASHVGPHCPPTLLLQGGHDLCLMLPDVRRLHQALCDAGVPSVYVEFPETEHAFDLLFPCSPAAQAATCDTERFLALMV